MAPAYAPRHRAEWLAKIVEPGVRVRAEHSYQQLDSLQPLRLQARRELLRQSDQHPAVKLLRQIPSIGPIRAALLVALLQTPHRFRTKRQLWAYSGEERSEFRPQTFASASSLSISGEEGFPSLGFSPVVVGRVLEMLGSRVSISQ